MAGGNWVHNGSPALDAESKYQQIMAVSITLTVIMTIIVSLRAYVRAFLLKTLGPDDWAIFFGALCTIAYTGLCVGQTKWGLGLPTSLRPKANLPQFSVINFSGKPIYVAGVLMFKVSICLSYLRILAQSSRLYRQIIWIVLVACTLGHVGGILVLIFLCKPIQRSWKPLTPGTCIPNVNSIYGLGAVSIFFDIIIIILPIPMVTRLQINNRKKVGLVIIFTLGIFTTFCSIMRLVQVKPIVETGDVTGLVLWATVEMNIGTILTCLPTLLPLIKYYNDKKASSAQNTYGLENTRRNHGFIKTHESSTGTTNDPVWQDRDSVDNSSHTSQKKILGLEHTLEVMRSEERLANTPPKAGEGIIATTEVQVKHSALTNDDLRRERERKAGGRW